MKKTSPMSDFNLWISLSILICIHIYIIYIVRLSRRARPVRPVVPVQSSPSSSSSVRPVVRPVAVVVRPSARPVVRPVVVLRPLSVRSVVRLIIIYTTSRSIRWTPSDYYHLCAPSTPPRQIQTKKGKLDEFPKTISGFNCVSRPEAAWEYAQILDIYSVLHMQGMSLIPNRNIVTLSSFFNFCI